MASRTARATSVALIGNPNTGKSTLFNALSGSRQRVGNYPGCTVEKKIGKLKLGDQQLDLIDLPGTYSLSPRSPDEMVAVDVLLGRQTDVGQPDAIVCIVDASNLERNLYLVSQVLELGLPTVLALNMVDLATSQGITVDVAELQKRLGVPIVSLQAHRGRGVDELKQQIQQVLDRPLTPPPSPFPSAFQAEVGQLEAAWKASAVADPKAAVLPHYLAERLLLDTSGYLVGVLPHGTGWDLAEHLKQARLRLKGAACPIPAIEAISRYGWASKQLAGVVQRPTQRPVTFSDKLDRWLTNRWFGSLTFLLLMILVFQVVFVGATPLMDAIETAQGWVGEQVAGWVPEGAVQSLLVDGIVGGVGGVLVFLPQILILFMFIGILEDCGYMARAAYLMDKLMSKVGLSGKSFIPMLTSFGCAIPGIMATRVIENPRDRLTTILVAPLMSCGARLPVYIILTTAFVANQTFLYGLISLQGLVIAGMYFVGIVAAVGMALLLKKTLLRGETPPFVMELPSYKWPSLKTVFFRVVERGWEFLKRAGTIILAMTVIVWALGYWPRQPVELDTHEGKQAQLAGSYLGQMGHAIEPLVEPLGWDWRIGAATIASFPAREVVVAVLGVIYNLGDEIDIEKDEDKDQMVHAMQTATWREGTARAGQPVYNLPVALSIMVFFALCAQCGATLATIKRETNSWFWPVFTFVYMTTLAYIGAFLTYRIGMWVLAVVS